MGTDDFLPGVLVLNYSLKKHDNNAPLIALINEGVSPEIIDFLEMYKIPTKIINPIDSSNYAENKYRGFAHIFSKLHIFNCFEYEKIVYLDADLLICDNIESLFERPHMSAVSAGSVLPENANWTKFNGGVMVIEPHSDLFKKLLSILGSLPTYELGDQGFLNSYYCDWENKSHLHLPHKYNIPVYYIDRYCLLPDFHFNYLDRKLEKKNISILHFWGNIKPWDVNNEDFKDSPTNKFEQCVNLWWSYFHAME
jgi:alpha-N-acetylglucosamine transferase